MTRKSLILAACLLLLATAGLEVSADGLVNEEVKRTVDLGSHLAKITAEIVLSNQGNSAVHSFLLAVEPDLAPHLAYIGASVSPTPVNQITPVSQVCSLAVSLLASDFIACYSFIGSAHLAALQQYIFCTLN